MGKMIFAINSTIEGSAGHASVFADDELHDFHTDLLKSADAILFGTNTYRLMEDYWPTAHQDAQANAATLRFADQINNMPKIVISNSLGETRWENARLIKGDLAAEVKKLKQEYDRIAVGGLKLANSLADLGQIDEYWFLVQPILSGKEDAGDEKPPKLFDNLLHTQWLQFLETKTLGSGVVALHYKTKT